MKFKINDSVAVLDDDLSGTITKIEGSEITVATTNGFELVFEAHELVKINQDKLMDRSLFSNASLESVLSDKESKKRQNPPRVSTKERAQPAMEVDLHINQLVRSSRGMQNHEMLGRRSSSPSIIMLNPLMVSLISTNTPFRPVNCSATWNG